jgi:hypothetical protein
VTRPVTPAQVEAELCRLEHKLEERTDALAGLLQVAAEADVAHRLAFAKALLAADSDTVSERLPRSRPEPHQLSAVQSVNANVRFQAGLSST